MKALNNLQMAIVVCFKFTSLVFRNPSYVEVVIRGAIATPGVDIATMHACCSCLDLRKPFQKL